MDVTHNCSDIMILFETVKMEITGDCKCSLALAGLFAYRD